MSTVPVLSSSSSSSWPGMLAGVISESNRVLSSHTRHFLSLSVFFLLPLSSLLISSPSLLIHLSSSSSSHPQSLLRSSSPPPHLSLSLLLTVFIFAIVILLLLLSAFSSVAHSVHRSFFGRPVNILPSLSSIPSSLLRLLSLSAPFFSLLIVLLSLFFVFFPFKHIFLIAAFSSLPLIYLFVISSLAFPIAVLEREWGIRPVIRSTHLIKGMKWAFFCLFLFFAFALGLVFWGFSLGDVKGEIAVPVVVAKTVFGSAVLTVMFLYWMVSCVVMYLYCKAMHGELAAEIAEEFAWEYVCLPFDEEKVPRVVSVVRQ